MLQKPDKLSISAQLAFNTVNITILKVNGASTGTGFIFDYMLNDGTAYPVIVTNKHVIEDAKRINLTFTTANSDGTPNTSKHHSVSFTDIQRCILHPDPEIELALIPIKDIIEEAISTNIPLFYISLDKDLLPTEEQVKALNGIEDIVMIGYPLGLSDTFNNYPIYRKGITATHPANRYEGREEFVIDISCFPGSSGSPVYILNEGTYVSRGTVKVGTRVFLLGIVYASHKYDERGNIKIAAMPEPTDGFAITRIFTNLGFAIRSSKLLDFEPIIKEKLDK